MEIDLNADVGEGYPTDEALIALVSSANIACGWHAGDSNVMRDCVRYAVRNGVAIGAHPSFNDPEHFGRSELHLPARDIYSGVLYQLGALAAIAHAAGSRIAHLKPHGALYNQAARDPTVADAIISAVHDFDPTIAVFALAHSSMVDAVRRAGVRVVEEAFADRGYLSDGSLVSRKEPGAMLTNDDDVLARITTIIRDKRVRSIDGQWVPIDAQTICLHGDGPHALRFAQVIRRQLDAEGVIVRAPA